MTSLKSRIAALESKVQNRPEDTIPEIPDNLSEEEFNILWDNLLIAAVHERAAERNRGKIRWIGDQVEIDPAHRSYQEIEAEILAELQAEIDAETKSIKN